MMSCLIPVGLALAGKIKIKLKGKK